MIIPFNEVSQADNKVVGTVGINPRQIVRVTRGAAGDGQAATLVTILEDVNKKQTRVEGGITNVIQALNQGAR